MDFNWPSMAFFLLRCHGYFSWTVVLLVVTILVRCHSSFSWLVVLLECHSPSGLSWLFFLVGCPGWLFWLWRGRGGGGSTIPTPPPPPPPTPPQQQQRRKTVRIAKDKAKKLPRGCQDVWKTSIFIISTQTHHHLFTSGPHTLSTRTYNRLNLWIFSITYLTMYMICLFL